MTWTDAARPTFRHMALLLGFGAGAGGVIGGAVRWIAADAAAAERASAAVLVAFAVAVCVAPIVNGRVPVGVFRGMACVAAAAVTGGVCAGLAVFVAGGIDASGVPGAITLVGGAAALAAGGAALARTSRTLSPGSGLLGALLPLLLAALVFVADPWIEWRGSGPASPAKAAWVYRLSPIAAATSPEGGTGVDWQTRSLLYDGGTEGGSGGLSVIGQYYPSRPAHPIAWGGLALLAGLLFGGAGAWRSRVA